MSSRVQVNPHYKILPRRLGGSKIGLVTTVSPKKKWLRLKQRGSTLSGTSSEMVLVLVSLRMAAISAKKLDFERDQNTSDGSSRKFS